MYILLLRSCKLMDAFVISSLPPVWLEKILTVWPLCSSGIAPLHYYYGPIRHPLAFDSLPSVAGYRIYLSPEISPRGKEGFSSCSVCPCRHAVATTPPKYTVVSASFQMFMLPSPYGCGLGLRRYSLSRPPMRSLSLRPDDSLHSKSVLVNRLQCVGFP